jgi:type 1 glutamine amidotransferase
MANHLARIILGGIIALGAFGLAGAGQSDKIKVLIVDGQNNHNWQATTPQLKRILEESGRFVVDVATSPQMPRAAQGKKVEAEELQKYKEAMAKFRLDFAKYDVVLSNYNGDRWPEQTRRDLEEYVTGGQGLVIIHAANNAFGDWKEYNSMIGMGWRDAKFGDRLTVDDQGREVRVEKGKGPGAGHGAQHPFLVTVRNPEHPITHGMPREWMHAQDELYHGMRGPAEHVTLLATAFDEKAKGGTGEHEPMIWTVTYGKGRVFHTPMGHDLTGMRCVGFIATVQRGTEWAATGKVTIPIPDNFPTATETRSANSK